MRRRDNPLGVGVIAAGGIFYIQRDGRWRDRYRGAPLCRDPWIVVAFLNGTMAAVGRNRDTGKWEDVILSGGSDRALVRSLRHGCERHVAVRTLILHEDHGLTKGPALYPSLPEMKPWRRGGQSRAGIFQDGVKPTSSPKPACRVAARPTAAPPGSPPRSESRTRR